jgi:hypothetical protein
MTEEAAREVGIDQSSATEDGGKRDRSTIQFPYLPLEEAIIIAKGVHAVGGASCTVDQLAAHLKQKPDTGSFRLKLGTAKLFGLTTHSMGTVTLTTLGARICDSQQEQAAKAEAFMKIPLYERVYEQFKGGSLPPPGGLEAAMVNMGVAPKQRAVARQVFHRSATLAGFFWSGENRLVYPPKGSSGSGSPSNERPKEKDELGNDTGRKSGGDGGGGDDPAIQGLIKRLPPADEPWPLEKQQKWLLAIAGAFDVIYPRDDDKRTLRITIEDLP